MAKGKKQPGPMDNAKTAALVKTMTEEAEEKKGKNDKPKKQDEENKSLEQEKNKMRKEEEREKDPKSPPPRPPEEVVMRVLMHCEGCARQVRRSLRGLEGVEEVKADNYWTNTVVVKGSKVAEDPTKLVERVQKKCGKKAELISPLPSMLPPPPTPATEPVKTEMEKAKTEEDAPLEMVIVLKLDMHCDACAEEIKRRILKMKGMQEAKLDKKASRVTVKGTVEPASLVDFVRKHTGKHAAILKAEPSPPSQPPSKDTPPAMVPVTKFDEVIGVKKEEEEVEMDTEAEENQADTAATEEVAVEKEKVNLEAPMPPTVVAAMAPVEAAGRNELYYYYHPPTYAYPYPYPHPYPHPYMYARNPVEYGYAPQAFSDENPNACTIM